MKYLQKCIILTIISSLFFIPQLCHFDINTIAGGYNYLAQMLPFVLMVILLFLWIIINNEPQSLINNTSLYLLTMALALAVHYAIIKPAYTSPYLIPISLFIITSAAIIAATNCNIKSSSMVNAISIGILINSYIQVIFSILQIINYKFLSQFIIYGSPQPYGLIVSWFQINNYGRISGSVAQPNIMAELLTWGLIANVWLIKPNSKLKNIFFIFNCVVFCSFITLTQSRSSYIYPLLICSYALWCKKHDTQKRAKTLLVSGLCLIFCFILYAVWNNYAPVLNTMHQSVELNHEVVNSTIYAGDRIGSIHQRYIMWVKGVLIFLKHPLIGVGWDGFCQYYGITPLPFFAHNALNSELSPIDNAHNLIVQLLATTGIIGTTLIGFIIFSCIKNLINPPHKKHFVALGIFLVTLTHSMVEFPLYTSYNFVAIAIIIGSIDNKYKIRISTRLLKITFGVIILIAGWQLYVGINNYLILAELKKSPHYQTSNLLGNELDKYLTINTNPYWDYRADINFAYNLMFNDKSQNNTRYFNLLYDTVTKINTYLPNPVFEIKKAILDIMIGNNAQAKQEIKLMKNNYPGYEKIFSAYTTQLTPENSAARKQVLEIINSPN